MLSAEIATGTRPVFNHCCLAEYVAEIVPQHARQNVSSTAGWKVHHDGDRFAWELSNRLNGLPPRRADIHQQHRDANEQMFGAVQSDGHLNFLC